MQNLVQQQKKKAEVTAKNKRLSPYKREVKDYLVNPIKLLVEREDKA
jgi:hypothetical protein